ncbi:hypothetical protein E1281_02650 [Actinomadura sp. KC345]|uniref:hypothetical protein n=1 Tax=Actinomadura sp. KC345 TaxID=2530371 RepID=UPI00104583C7|nr:hypothetical protein [Actinomadura sp. KC345]TDC58099.1 hypothetical protein E1281_02650 [Actinomadura sp. KC345]
MPTITLRAVNVPDKGEMGKRKVKAVLCTELGLPLNAAVSIRVITWNSSPQIGGGLELHTNVKVEYDL